MAMRALEEKGIIISSGRPDAGLAPWNMYSTGLALSNSYSTGLEVKPQDVLLVLEPQVGDFAS